MIEIYILLIRRLRLVDDSPGRDGGFDLVQVLDVGHGVALQKTLLLLLLLLLTEIISKTSSIILCCNQ